MNQVVVAVLGLCGFIVTAFGAWIIAKHQRSGKVDTTDAGDLWQEGKDLRLFLLKRLEAQENELRELKVEVRTLHEQVAQLRAELRTRGGQ